MHVQCDTRAFISYRTCLALIHALALRPSRTLPILPPATPNPALVSRADRFTLNATSSRNTRWLQEHDNMEVRLLRWVARKTVFNVAS